MKRRHSYIFVATLAFLATLSISCSDAGEDDPRESPEDVTISVGSKLFTESVILGEVAVALAEQTGYGSQRKFELGGTRFVWNALLSGDIDVYPEYTGTLTQEIFAGTLTDDQIVDTLETLGVSQTSPLGFNNTYAIGMSRTAASELGIRTISDLAAHPELRLAFSNEFLDRVDGWPGLRSVYNLPHSATGLDHSLAYRGVESGDIDVIDLYATDAEIDYYDLAVLADDKEYFPRYDALFLYRADLAVRAPLFVDQLTELAGQIAEPTMIAMNKAVKLDGDSEINQAAKLLSKNAESVIETQGLFRRVLQRTSEHLWLVLVSLIVAILIAIPLGVAAAKIRILQSPVLGVVAILYTIPSLALLVFMIPLLGIGTVPAIAALFIYSLLPIVRNTFEGLAGIPTELRETADSLGLGSATRLFRIELPLASRSILAGIKTAAVLNIGTATLGALIGAGGYGQPILTGIRLDDTSLILEGAVPAALLAVLAQGLLELAGNRIIPRGLRDDL